MAKCETCRARPGWIPYHNHRTQTANPLWRPCPDCMGGVSSCCDGAVPSAFEGEYQAKPINGGID